MTDLENTPPRIEDQCHEDPRLWELASKSRTLLEQMTLLRIMEGVTEKLLMPIVHSGATPFQPAQKTHRRKKRRETKTEDDPIVYLRACSLPAASLPTENREEPLSPAASIFQGSHLEYLQLHPGLLHRPHLCLL